MTPLEAELAEFVRAIVREEIAALPVAAPAQVWFTVEEAAEYLRVSQRTLERLVADGKVRSRTVERRRIIRRPWLDEHATARDEAQPSTSPRRHEALPSTRHKGGSHAG